MVWQSVVIVGCWRLSEDKRQCVAHQVRCDDWRVVVHTELFSKRNASLAGRELGWGQAIENLWFFICMGHHSLWF